MHGIEVFLFFRKYINFLSSKISKNFKKHLYFISKSIYINNIVIQ